MILINHYIYCTLHCAVSVEQKHTHVDLCDAKFVFLINNKNNNVKFNVPFGVLSRHRGRGR